MMDKTSWEAVCRRCGRCCYEKVDYDGDIFYTDEPCEFLDLTTRLCTVYDRRHEARSGCVPLTAAIFEQGILPADCPYVAGHDNYRAPTLWSDEDPS